MSNITALSGVRVLETSGHAIRHARMPFMFKHISIHIQLSSVSLQTVSVVSFIRQVCQQRFRNRFSEQQSFRQQGLSHYQCQPA